MIKSFSKNTNVLVGLERELAVVFGKTEDLYEITVFDGVSDKPIIMMVEAADPFAAKAWCLEKFGREPEAIHSVEDVLNLEPQRDGCTS